jgi:hypothetical protein
MEHPFQSEMVVGTLTRRVAAGWLILPFQDIGKNVILPYGNDSKIDSYLLLCFNVFRNDY